MSHELQGMLMDEPHLNPSISGIPHTGRVEVDKESCKLQRSRKGMAACFSTEHGILSKSRWSRGRTYRLLDLGQARFMYSHHWVKQAIVAVLSSGQMQSQEKELMREDFQPAVVVLC